MNIIKADEQGAISIIESVLKRNAVVVLPTDTIYGLICNAKSQDAVKKIFQIKQRNCGKPIGIFVKDIRMAEEFANINEKQKKLIKKHWPGRITFVLEKKLKTNLVSPIGTDNTIGIRVAGYDLIQRLFKIIDFPLAQTSVNISGMPSLVTAEDIIGHFKNRKDQPELIVNAGFLKESKASTVVDFTGAKHMVLRQGDIKLKIRS